MRSHLPILNNVHAHFVVDPRSTKKTKKFLVNSLVWGSLRFTRPGNLLFRGDWRLQSFNLMKVIFLHLLWVCIFQPSTKSMEEVNL